MTQVIHSGTQLVPEPLDTLCVWEGLCDIVGSSFPDPIKDVLLPKLSHSRLFRTPWAVAHQAPLSMDSPGKNTRVFCHFLLQGIFPTQDGTHVSCVGRQILYCLIHQGSLHRGHLKQKMAQTSTLLSMGQVMKDPSGLCLWWLTLSPCV